MRFVIAAKNGEIFPRFPSSYIENHRERSQACKFGTNVGLDMLINISFGFVITTSIFFINISFSKYIHVGQKLVWKITITIKSARGSNHLNHLAPCISSWHKMIQPTYLSKYNFWLTQHITPQKIQGFIITIISPSSHESDFEPFLT